MAENPAEGSGGRALTPLDLAKAALDADPGNPAHHATFALCLLQGEYLVLTPSPEATEPTVFDAPSGAMVLAFDTADRLAEFVSEPTSYLAMEGRDLAAWLGSAGLILGINFEVSAHPVLLDAQMIAWLQAQNRQVDRVEWPIQALRAPQGIAPAFVDRLRSQLADMPGLGQAAVLVEAVYADEESRPLVMLIDVAPALEEGLARMIAEVAALTGVAPDLAFARTSDPRARDALTCGQVFPFPPAVDLPAPPLPGAAAKRDEPPRLR